MNYYAGTSNSRLLDGKLDNVRIYDRSLTAEEINDIYHAERGDVCELRSDGLVAHYTFDNAADLGNDDSG